MNAMPAHKVLQDDTIGQWGEGSDGKREPTADSFAAMIERRMGVADREGGGLFRRSYRMASDCSRSRRCVRVPTDRR